MQHACNLILISTANQRIPRTRTCNAQVTSSRSAPAFSREKTSRASGEEREQDAAA